MKNVEINEVYELQTKCKALYKSINLINLFKKYPKKVNGLNFGYICPGAMKTIEFLNKKSNKFDKKILKNIALLTDFHFFFRDICNL
jgi:hypothetical protein